MKLSAIFKLIIFISVTSCNFVVLESVKANTFDEKEINPNQVIAVSTPYRNGHNLLVIEQIEGKNKCWSEQGTTPVIIDPLLMNFDFKDDCRRATDTNGYSIRLNGQEAGTDYLLKLVQQNNEMHLIAVHRNPNQPNLFIGRTYGQNDSMAKIFLNPGWRFTKRSYQGQELSHFYFSQDLTSVATSN